MKFIVYGTFFVPLFVSSQYFIFPFIVPKVLLFRSLVLILLFLYFILLYKNKEAYHTTRTPMNITILFFLGSFAVSTFVGVDWYRSFWDNHERMLGLFTLIHYIAYYFILSSVYKDSKDWLLFSRVFLFAGSIVMLIGLWQRVVDPQALLNSGAERVASTLGNSIYVSSFGIFLLALGAILFFEERVGRYKMMAIFGGVLGFGGILLGGSRGSLIAFCVFVAVFFATLFALRKDVFLRKKIAVSFGILLVLGGVIFAFRNTAFIKSIPAVGRLADTSFHTSTPRTMAWGVAYDAWKEYPLFGWGPNNFFYAFNKFYRPAFLEHGWGETWFDNAHNIVMNTLAVQGAVGLASYLAVFIVAFFVVWRAYIKEKLQVTTIAVLCGFLVAHFVNNLFVFENPTSYLYFFFLLAFINSTETVKLSQNVKHKRTSIAYIGAIGIVLLIIFFKTNVNPAKANMYSLAAIRNLRDPGGAVELMKQAYGQYSPHTDDIRADFARASYPVMVNLYNGGRKDVIGQLYAFNYEELKKNLTLHPLDIRTHMILAEQLTVQAQIAKDLKYLYEAERLLENALKLSPKRQQYKFYLANIKMQIRKNDEAIALVKEAIEDDYKVLFGWYNLLTIYDTLQKKPEAEALVLEAKSRGVVLDENYLKTIRILQK